MSANALVSRVQFPFGSYGPVAQWLEHSFEVAGSNPALTVKSDSSTVEHYSWEVG
jgi:hypothetical protein